MVSEAGKEYRRHVSHLQKINGAAAAGSNGDIKNKAANNTDDLASKTVSTRTGQQTKRKSDTIMTPRVTRASMRQAHLKDFVI